MEGIVIIGWLFAIVLVILWTLLPFAVFGVKDRLNMQIALLTEIRNELRRLNDGKKSEHQKQVGMLKHEDPIEVPGESEQPEQQVSIDKLYSDPAEKWFNKKGN